LTIQFKSITDVGSKNLGGQVIYSSIHSQIINQ